MTNVVGDIWECAVEFGLGGERGTVVFHKEVVEVSDTDEAAMGGGITVALDTLAQASLMAYLGGGSLVICSTARRVPPADVTRVYVKYGDGTPSVASISVAAQSSVLFSMYPAPGGEIKSGRNFIPFLASAEQISGQLLTANKTALELSFSEWLLLLLEITEGDLKPVLYRYATELDPHVVVDIAEMVLRPVLASQRRRVKHHQPFTA
jgi:hypothetical protein